MASRLPDVLHVVFPGAAHNLLRLRTKAVLRIERAAVRGGFGEAASVAREAVVDSPRHPQHVVARVAEGYLALAEAAKRPATRRGAAALALVALIALARRASRLRAPG